MPKKKSTKPVRSRTEAEYHTTQKYLQQWLDENNCDTFAQFLQRQKMVDSTRIKHLRHTITLKKRGLKIDRELGYITSPVAKPPPIFSDDDFEKLYEAFNDSPKPAFIQEGERHRYWQCIIHFAAVTALRREAILGLQIGDVNFQELYITVPPGIDKKNTERH